jgi:hypothetical protein
VIGARLSAGDLAARPVEELTGAVLLAPVRLPGHPLAKGTRLDAGTAALLLAAARDGALPEAVRLAWPEPGDVHEDEAADRLAREVAGAGIEQRPPRQSRLDLAARWDGVLHVRTAALAHLNAIDPLEVFTLFHGQAVLADEVVAAVKVAPHLLPARTVAEGVRIAREEGPLVEVRPYRAMVVGAIAAEAMRGEALARFEAGARTKLESLGSTFAGTTLANADTPEELEARSYAALRELAVERALPLLLVGGVSAGDPLSPFYAALERLGGRLLRRGVPAHPGSMIWLAELGGTRLLGLPQCGMFTLATAADIILPRLLTGEVLDAAALADLGHGGLLTRDMRFRFPAYARDLAAPEG